MPKFIVYGRENGRIVKAVLTECINNTQYTQIITNHQSYLKKYLKSSTPVLGLIKGETHELSA